MKNFRSCLSRISVCTALGATVTAAANAGSLEGKITHDANGVSSAVVSAYQTGTGRKSVTLTNASGACLFQSPESCQREVHCSR